MCDQKRKAGETAKRREPDPSEHLGRGTEEFSWWWGKQLVTLGREDGAFAMDVDDDGVTTLRGTLLDLLARGQTLALYDAAYHLARRVVLLEHRLAGQGETLPVVAVELKSLAPERKAYDQVSLLHIAAGASQLPCSCSGSCETCMGCEARDLLGVAPLAEPSNPWMTCEHDWKSYGDSDLGDVAGLGPREEVKCVRCGCPGERYELSGLVEWPTT